MKDKQHKLEQAMVADVTTATEQVVALNDFEQWLKEFTEGLATYFEVHKFPEGRWS